MVMNALHEKSVVFKIIHYGLQKQKFTKRNLFDDLKLTDPEISYTRKVSHKL